MLDWASLELVLQWLEEGGGRSYYCASQTVVLTDVNKSYQNSVMQRSSKPSEVASERIEKQHWPSELERATMEDGSLFWWIAFSFVSSLTCVDGRVRVHHLTGGHVAPGCTMGRDTPAEAVWCFGQGFHREPWLLPLCGWCYFGRNHLPTQTMCTTLDATFLQHFPCSKTFCLLQMHYFGLGSVLGPATQLPRITK